MTAANDKSDMMRAGYKVDLWDALSILEDLPMQRGRGCYARTWRKSLNDLYSELKEKISSDPSVEFEGNHCFIWKNDLTRICKQRSIWYVHQLSMSFLDASVTDEDKEALQANIDLFSLCYDKFREEL